jgi:hypothetical protein
MKVGRHSVPPMYSLIGALILISTSLIAGQALDDQKAADSHQHQSSAQDNELVRIVRESTERFKDVMVAEGEGDHLAFGCVSGGDFGAMGMHFLKAEYLDGDLDPAHPEIIIYEPTKDGRLKLTGVDFLVTKEAWEAKHPDEGPPELKGQLLHLFESPNRFGLGVFYTLHVWAWKDNPNGTFVNWHPNVSCDTFNPRVP